MSNAERPKDSEETLAESSAEKPHHYMIFPPKMDPREIAKTLIADLKKREEC
jgi:hypothetical protein